MPTTDSTHILNNASNNDIETININAKKRLDIDLNEFSDNENHRKKRKIVCDRCKKEFIQISRHKCKILN